jgi:hypothetical protein
MFPRVLSELRQKLFPAASVGNIPLRAYGKLGFDPEFLRVGCDDQPAAQSFANWVAAGFDRCERIFGRGGFQVRPSRLVLGADGGRTWITACIWPSHDQTTEQGAGRAFPFALFAVLPAPAVSRQVPATLPTACTPLWDELSRSYQPIINVDGREAFVRGVRAQTLPLPTAPRHERPSGAMEQAAHIDFRDWVSTAVEGDSPFDILVSGLERALLELRSAKPRNSTAWILPVSSSVPLAPQLAVWMEWLTVNLGCAWSDFAILTPLEETTRGQDVSIIARPFTTEDFSGLLVDPSQSAPSLGWRVRKGGNLTEGHEELARNVLASLSAESPKLGDFARVRFPLPTGSWVAR